MGLLLLVFFLIFPRIALLLIFFFSNYLERAYHGLLVPFLGFLFLPLTTLVYSWIVNTGQALTNFNLLLLIITVVVDLGGLGTSEYHRRTRWIRV